MTKISESGIKRSMTINEYLLTACKRLDGAGVCYGHGMDNAWDEVIQLFCFAAEVPLDSDPAILEQPMTEAMQSKFEAVFKIRLEERKPTAYITGIGWFCQLPFAVNQHTLIPRSPIGEWLEKAFSPWLQRSPKRVLDMCTGSGCLGITAAMVFPEARVDLVDISEQALQVAQKNIDAFSLNDRVTVIHSDLFENLAEQEYDLILCNPPYVSAEEMAELPPEYEYEPRLALHADEDGLAIVERFLQQVQSHLAPNGVLVLDLGYSAQLALHRFNDWPFIELDCERGGEGILLYTKGEHD